MSEWVIVGDTAKYEGCLVRVCGKFKENAEKELQRMLTAPDTNDLYFMKDHTNFRIEEVADEQCWWNDPFLCN